MSTFRRNIIHSCNTELKKYSFPRDSKPRSMNGNKVAYHEVPNTFLQINQVYVCNCHKMTNCKQFRKNSSRCLFDENVTRMLQQEGILSEKVVRVRNWVRLNFNSMSIINLGLFLNRPCKFILPHITLEFTSTVYF